LISDSLDAAPALIGMATSTASEPRHAQARLKTIGRTTVTPLRRSRSRRYGDRNPAGIDLVHMPPLETQGKSGDFGVSCLDTVLPTRLDSHDMRAQVAHQPSRERRLQ